MLIRKLLLEAEPSRPTQTTQQQQDAANQTQQVASNAENIDLPQDALEKLSQGKWWEAYDQLATEADVERLMELFLDTYPGLARFKDEVELIKKPLIRYMRSLGRDAFSEATNPMLTFLNTYFSQNNKFTEDEFRKLINLYARGIIADKQLKERNVNKSILFNPHLYQMKEPDMQFVVQAYLWLSKENNVKRYLDLKDKGSQAKNSENSKIRAEVDAELNNIIGEQGRKDNGEFDYKQLDYNKFRDLVIFKKMDNPMGEINPAQEIKARLDRLEQNLPAKDDEADRTKTTTPSGRKTVEFTPQRYSTTEIDGILKKGLDNLTKSDISKLFTFLSEYKGAK